MTGDFSEYRVLQMAKEQGQVCYAIRGPAELNGRIYCTRYMGEEESR